MRRFRRTGSGTGSVPPDDALVAAEDVCLVIGGRTILQAITLRLAPNEIVTVVGPNGAGKTMLIRVLIGLIRPTAGQVKRHSGLRVGYLPQMF